MFISKFIRFFILLLCTLPTTIVQAMDPSQAGPPAGDPGNGRHTPPPTLPDQSFFSTPLRNIVRGLRELKEMGKNVPSPKRVCHGLRPIVGSPFKSAHKVRTTMTDIIRRRDVPSGAREQLARETVEAGRRLYQEAVSVPGYERTDDTLDELRKTALSSWCPSLLSGAISPRSPEFYHRIGTMGEPARLHAETEARFPIPRKQRVFDRMFSLEHIVNGSRNGGGHVWNSNWISLTGPSGNFRPLINLDTHVVYAWPIGPNGSPATLKSIFPPQIIHDEQTCVDTFNGVIDDGTFLSAETGYRGQKRFCGRPANSPTLIEAVSYGDPATTTDFLRVITGYPIFAQAIWTNDRPLILAHVQEFGSGAPAVTLQLPADEALSLAHRSLLDQIFINALPDDGNPLRYVNKRENTAIIDLAPILQYVSVNEAHPFWAAFPRSIIPCGLYVTFPLDRLPPLPTPSNP